MKILISVCRFLVGVLFIFSGLVKANDPLGLSYKMQEFFEVWNFHWLDNFTLAFSIVMIVFEIVAGVAILLGWRMRLFSWLYKRPDLARADRFPFWGTRTDPAHPDANGQRGRTRAGDAVLFCLPVVCIVPFTGSRLPAV